MVELTANNLAARGLIEDLEAYLVDNFKISALPGPYEGDTPTHEGRGTKKANTFHFPWTAAFAFSTILMLARIGTAPLGDTTVTLKLHDGSKAIEFSLTKHTTKETLLKFFLANGITAAELEKLSKDHNEPQLIEVIKALKK